MSVPSSLVFQFWRILSVKFDTKVENIWWPSCDKTVQKKQTLLIKVWHFFVVKNVTQSQLLLLFQWIQISEIICSAIHIQFFKSMLCDEKWQIYNNNTLALKVSRFNEMNACFLLLNVFAFSLFVCLWLVKLTEVSMLWKSFWRIQPVLIKTKTHLNSIEYNNNLS